MRGFKAGFRNRNPFVLVAAGALLVPALLGFQYLFTSGAWSNVPLKYCLRNSGDSFTYVSWTVGKNKWQPPAVPCIYITGGSASREAVVSGPALAAEVKQLGGPHVAAWDLGSINQNFAETLAVADNVPLSPAWVLIGVNLGRFTEFPAQNEQQVVGRDFLLKSAFLQRYVSRTYGRYKYSYTILPGIMSYLTGYLKKDGRTLLAGKAVQRQYVQHQYTVSGNASVARKQAMVHEWLTKRYPVFRSNLQYNLAMLKQILVRCRERGVHAVILELPSNEGLIAGRFDAAKVAYQTPTKALAAQFGVPYVDFNAGLRLPDGDFHDLSHLVEPGRVLWQHRLAQELLKLMGPSGNGAGTQ